MAKYKNAIFVLVSLILFGYAGFISIVPMVKTNTFDIDKFEQQVFDATSLVTTVDSVDYKIKPNLETTITVKNLSLKYIDAQPLFDAKHIEIKTTPAALFTPNYKIKSIYFKRAWYADQILPNKENKIAFLPGAFNSEIFGAKKITVEPGPAKFKDLKVTYVTPTTYKEKNLREVSFTKSEVESFLKSFHYSHVKIK